MPNISKGLLVLISGPSGVGKGTIVDLVRERIQDVVFVLSETTREKRSDEKNGVQYNFVPEDVFKMNIEKGLFLEWAIVHGKEYYGVLKESVMKNLNANKLVLREVDIQGAETIRKLIPKDQLLTIFIAPENESVLLSRIANREKMSDEELARRMESMRKEMAEANKYNYKVVNYEGQIERCYLEVEGIIRSSAERRRIYLSGCGGALV